MSLLLLIPSVSLYLPGSLHHPCRGFTHSRAAVPSSLYPVQMLWPQAMPVWYCDHHSKLLCYYDMTDTIQLTDCVLVQAWRSLQPQSQPQPGFCGQLS